MPAVSGEEKRILTVMEATRWVVSRALEQRSKAGIKVRQPIAKVTVPHTMFMPGEKAYLDLVADEVNAKTVELADVTDVTIDTQLTPELLREGHVRDFLRAVQDLRKKKGLNPGDKVALSMAGDAGAITIVKSAEAEIMRVASLSKINYGGEVDNGEEVNLGGEKATVALH
jgi:isoleucyl-tRNA synthetase